VRLLWGSRRERVDCAGDCGDWMSPFVRDASTEETMLIGREGRGVLLTVDTLLPGGRVMAVDGLRSLLCCAIDSHVTSESWEGDTRNGRLPFMLLCRET